MLGRAPSLGQAAGRAAPIRRRGARAPRRRRCRARAGLARTRARKPAARPRAHRSSRPRQSRVQAAMRAAYWPTSAITSRRLPAAEPVPAPAPGRPPAAGSAWPFSEGGPIASSLTPIACSTLPTSPCRRSTRSQRSASSSGVRAKGIAVAAMPSTIAASGASVGGLLIEDSPPLGSTCRGERGGADHVVVYQGDDRGAIGVGHELEHHAVHAL